MTHPTNKNVLQAFVLFLTGLLRYVSFANVHSILQLLFFVPEVREAALREQVLYIYIFF